MRTRTFLTAVVALVIMGAGCTGPTERPDRIADDEPDVVFLRTAGGVTLLPAAPAGEAVTVPRAVPSTDWSTVVGAITRGSVTQVVARDAVGGRRLWARDVTGDLEVKVVSNHGTLVALGTPGGGYEGRTSTTLIVVGQNLSEPRTLTLAGNFEPEAFSADGLSLFLIQYRPARRPASYQVRRLDLETGSVEGVYSVDSHLQESMQGTARIQAADPDGGRLYTLYTVESADGLQHAFIHVLSLDELWAHCIVLPRSFATAHEGAMALSVGTNGRLYAANAERGTVAEIDTERLRVTRTIEAPFESRGGVAHAAVGPDGAVYVGKGTRLVALDVSEAQPRRSWDLGLEARILGLQAANDGSTLYVGSKDGVVSIDARAGTVVGVLDSPSIGVIDQLGRSTRPLQEPRRVLECAC